MNNESRDRLKTAIMTAATELNMDWRKRQTCSPGIKALAQMYAVVRDPNLLVAYETDLTEHDFRVLASFDAPEQFVWVVRKCGTHLLTAFGQGGESWGDVVRYLEAIKHTHPDAPIYTFDGDKLREVSIGEARDFIKGIALAKAA